MIDWEKVDDEAESIGLTQKCVCGHIRKEHLLFWGVCRPGFVCNAECLEFKELENVTK